MAIGITETLHVRESLRARKKTVGKGGWMVDIRMGDDYTRNLDAWGKRELTIDHEHDVYKEVIELYNGTKLISSAKLSDHQG